MTYQKGRTAWNKGIGGLHLSPQTEFKKGQYIGETHPSWKGGVQKISKDCVYLYAGVNKRIRRPKKIYEEMFGEIPEGFVIYHRDGNKHNDNPENLIAISRTELLNLNIGRKDDGK